MNLREYIAQTGLDAQIVSEGYKPDFGLWLYQVKFFRGTEPGRVLEADFPSRSELIGVLDILEQALRRTAGTAHQAERITDLSEYKAELEQQVGCSLEELGLDVQSSYEHVNRVRNRLHEFLGEDLYRQLLEIIEQNSQSDSEKE